MEKLLKAMLAYDRYWFIKTRNNYYPIEFRIKSDESCRFYINDLEYGPEFDCISTAENWLYNTGCVGAKI